MIDLYMAIRGLQMLHIWCNPSIDMVDKFFIEERLKGLIYCPSKEAKARVYYFFRKNDLLAIFNKYGHLKLHLLHRVRKKYAYYRGWSKAYNGPLLEEYLAKKESRMDEKVEEFFATWSKVKDKDLLRPKDLAKHLAVTDKSIINYTQTLLEEGILQ